MRLALPLIFSIFILVACDSDPNPPSRDFFFGTWETPQGSIGPGIIRVEFVGDSVKWEWENDNIPDYPGCKVHSFYKGTWAPMCEENEANGRVNGCLDLDISLGYRSRTLCDDPTDNQLPVEFDFSSTLSLNVQDYIRYTNDPDTMSFDLVGLRRVDTLCQGCNWPF